MSGAGCNCAYFNASVTQKKLKIKSIVVSEDKMNKFSGKSGMLARVVSLSQYTDTVSCKKLTNAQHILFVYFNIFVGFIFSVLVNSK